MLMLSMLIMIRLHALYRHTSTGRQFALAEDLSHDMRICAESIYQSPFCGGGVVRSIITYYHPVLNLMN